MLTEARWVHLPSGKSDIHGGRLTTDVPRVPQIPDEMLENSINYEQPEDFFIGRIRQQH